MTERREPGVFLSKPRREAKLAAETANPEANVGVSSSTASS
jgi:hypothetical protein